MELYHRFQSTYIGCLLSVVLQILRQKRAQAFSVHELSLGPHEIPDEFNQQGV